MKITAKESISGSYGFLHAGDVAEVLDAKAEELIKAGLAEEFTGNIAEKDLKIGLDVQNKAVIMGAAKQSKSKEEPSKAGETDPANATVDGKKENKGAATRQTKEAK